MGLHPRPSASEILSFQNFRKWRMGAFAQAESESMSGNISWGKRQAMKEGNRSKGGGGPRDYFQ